jgi:prepilin-type N-terminal cleavage/methylation domain-containing protein
VIRARLQQLRPRREESGYSLIELLTVMAILGVVLGGLTRIFVSGSKAELDLNQRFQAQANGRLALDKIRREIHCASTATTTSTSVTLTMPTGCKTASNTTVTWCTSQVGSSTTRYALYRYQGSGTCTAGVQWADYLTSASAFTFTQQSSSTLAMVHVYLPVNLTPGKKRTYTLQDDIYLRNSTRTCVTGSPSPPC